MVAIPVEDSSFVTAGKGVTPTKATQLQPTGPVYGLSAWKIQTTVPLISNAGPEPWERASAAYSIGSDTWLVDGQVLVIPQGKVVTTPINFQAKSYGYNYVAGIVDNNEPVALWGSTDYTHQVGTVKPGSIWKITRYYSGADGSVWFDLGNDQWIPSFYFNNNLFYNFNTAYNRPDLSRDYTTQQRVITTMQHPFVVTIHGDSAKQTFKYPDMEDMFPGIYLDSGSQWLCYEVSYTDAIFTQTNWYKLGPEVWLAASYDSLD
ncbi:hypothetical protein JCM14202_3736 [Agrilactobacillus composti DSM 18527 = JCM 14202]|nr:hypothetical protein JCM14202_3736 [Agrilactobacillus composti DSM 18527 = JCM 14202]